MEKITKIGKDFEETVEEILSENNLTREDVIIKKGETHKSLFKKESIEVIVIPKSEIVQLSKEFLRDVLENLGLEVTFEVRKGEDRDIIKIYSDNNNIVIGHNGNTLRALEILVKQKIQTELGLFFPISLDVEDYKDKKNSRLERMAKKIAKEVASTNVAAHLENMNAYERRIIHNALTNFKGVKTKSEGEEPHRHVVISPSNN